MCSISMGECNTILSAYTNNLHIYMSTSTGDIEN